MSDFVFFTPLRESERIMDNPEKMTLPERAAGIFKKIFEIILFLRKNPAFNYIMLALLSVGVGILSLLLGATVFGIPMFKSYFASFTVVALNILPPMVLVFLLYFKRPGVDRVYISVVCHSHNIDDTLF